MNTLTVDDFIARLSPFSGKELLSPAEASLLQLKVAEIILDYTVDVPLLKFLSRFLSPDSYDEAVEERNIEHQCGYPLCRRSPHSKVRRASSSNGALETSVKYQIYNRKPSIILPNTYLSQYCCKEHYQASLFFRNQLSSEALFSRKNIMVVPPFAQVHGPWYENNITSLEEVLAKHKELKNQGTSLGEVIAMMNGLSVADAEQETSQLVKLIEDFEIFEHDEAGVGEDNEDHDLQHDRETSSRGVEGYITSDRSFGGYIV